MTVQNSQNKGVIIVAGGSGKRFGSELPKQFLEINGRPVLMHTIQQFYNAFPNIKIVVVLPETHHETWTKLCDDHQFEIEHEVVQGGKERFNSVKNGLEKVLDCDIVGVQDGVRPLTSTGLIQKCFETAQRHGTCVPAIPVTDSLRKGNHTNNIPINREGFFRIQTPQVFRNTWLQKAYDQVYDPDFTDDASVVEKGGYQIILTEGEESNIKLTNKSDLKLINLYLKEI